MEERPQSYNKFGAWYDGMWLPYDDMEEVDNV